MNFRAVEHNSVIHSLVDNKGKITITPEQIRIGFRAFPAEGSEAGKAKSLTVRNQRK